MHSETCSFTLVKVVRVIQLCTIMLAIDLYICVLQNQRRGRAPVLEMQGLRCPLERKVRGQILCGLQGKSYCCTCITFHIQLQH